MGQEQQHITDYTGLVVIHGDLFQFDKSGDFIFEYGNPANKQDIKALDVGIFYINGIYDHVNKKLLPPDAKNAYGSFKTFVVPKLYSEEWKNVDEDTRITFNSISIKHQLGYYLVGKALSDRLNGVLPSLEYDGLKYIVDAEKCELIQTDDLSKTISLGPEAFSKPSVVYYDTHSKMQIHADQVFSDYSEHTVQLKFPPLNEFDIVGYGKKYGLSPTVLVCTVPLEPDPTRIEKMQLSREEALKIERAVRDSWVIKQVKVNKRKKKPGKQRKGGG
ncbi:hypothetical protein [Chitinophaga niabensis]|uniref:Uncharacterized protein n=1 Tax=Chitinophaga niabensis TaxID=536979 RepID=A0A1N6E4M7_9BACT|nr:hypothetical protein [Chitinophaga niabensis]SIN77982.1 hypothetical protein SAMN04488055_1300 [Chitinophaga niabensis]